MKLRSRVTGLACLIALLLTACASQLPRPAEPAHRLYFPAVLQPVRKLGMDGCPGSVTSAAAFGMSWCHSWVADPGLLDGVETVPLIWDETHIYDPVGGSSRWLMEFNEPDWPAQANMPPKSAIMPTLIVETRFPDRQLVAPMVSRFGRQWLLDFRAEFFAATGRYPRWNALAFNCHMETLEACHERLDWFLARATEWGATEVWAAGVSFGTQAEVQAWQQLADATPRLARYGVYVSRQGCAGGGDWTWNCVRDGDPSLLFPDGSLTPKGRWWAQPFEAIP